MPSDHRDLTGFADFHQSYVSNYIQLADAKAGVVLTVSGGLIAYLLAQPAVRSALAHAEWISIVPAAALLTPALAFGLAFSVIRPRRGPLIGPVYFEAVAACGTQEYLHALQKLSADDLTAARIEHCHALSVICTRKYQALSWAIWLGLVGIVFTGVAIAALGL